MYNDPQYCQTLHFRGQKLFVQPRLQHQGTLHFSSKGQVVYYKATDEAVVVLSLHPDGNNPYYTVLMPNGTEKQTIGNKLAATYLLPGLSLNAKNNILGPSKKGFNTRCTKQLQVWYYENTRNQYISNFCHIVAIFMLVVPTVIILSSRKLMKFIVVYNNLGLSSKIFHWCGPY